MAIVRTTLQECIDLFNANEVSRERAIRGMEQLSEWGVAAAYWKKIGRELDADACKLLQRAIAQGDCYRDAVKELNEWVEKTVEDGIMTKEKALRIVYPKMQEEYDKYFKPNL